MQDSMRVLLVFLCILREPFIYSDCGAISLVLQQRNKNETLRFMNEIKNIFVISRTIRE